MKRNNTQNISILSICILILIILFSISELIHQNKVPAIFFSTIFVITYLTNSYNNKKRKNINDL